MKRWTAFEERARPFRDARVLADADVLTVCLVAERFGLVACELDVALGLAFAVRAPRVGDPAVDLGRIQATVEEERAQQRHGNDAEAECSSSSAVPLPHSNSRDLLEIKLPWPDATTWADKVFACAAAVGGAADTHLPFVRQDVVHMTDCGERETRRLLLTRRLYREQERVAAAFRTRAVAPLPDAALVPDLDAALLHHFPDAAGDPLRGAKAEARRAAHTAATRPLALVVGGPGTGKTFSVTRLLATLLAGATPHAAAPSGGELAIVLTAPTGKATARMREAIREATAENARASLDVSPEVRARLRDLPAETIHKLVGVRPDGSCRHHREHPLAADVVVVDEVSMVDLGLMRRLLDAVRPTARLVLLGDRDQLASVDAGCVLAELYEARDHALQGTVTTFTHSQRFAGAPDIGLVAASLQSYRTGHPDLAEHERPEERRAVAVRVMCEAEHATAEDVGRGESFATGHAHRRIAYLGEPARNERGFSRPKEDQLAALAEPYVAHFTLFDSVPEEDLERTEPAPYPANVVLGYAELLRRLRRGREWNPDILTEAVQRRIFAAFERYRVLATHREGPLGVSGLERALAERVRKHIHGEQGGAGRFWVGRPVLVTENAYDVRLMNGDVGLILPVRNGTLAVHFPTEHGLRAVATSRLPPHEGALAMTVHKSQGSQFDRIALVLAGRNSPIQTRELVYTGVTRAKNQLAWLGTREELEDALGRTVARTSGLGALLREPEPAPAS